MKKKLLTFSLLLLFLCPLSVFAQNATKTGATINHLAVYVLDLQKSGYFYEHIIGFDTIPEPFHDGKHIWLKIGAGVSLHIIRGAETKKEYYKNNHICFSVPVIEDFIDKLKKNGISYEDVSGNKNTISKRADGIKQIWLQDPDGYWIEINDAKE